MFMHAQLRNAAVRAGMFAPMYLASLSRSVVISISCSLLVACSSSSVGGGTGGSATGGGRGGNSGAGGTPGGSGGTPGSGGLSATGGATATGGAAAGRGTGGAAAVGGATGGTGGIAATGGQSGAGNSGGSAGSSAGAGGAAGGAVCGIPTSFAWSSPGPVVNPKSDAKHNIVALKDPSIVYYNGKWQLFISTVDTRGAYGMAYVTFPDWDHTANATFYYLDQTPTLVGYHTAPQIFFFAPQNKWYLVFQSGQPQYSTNTNIEDPTGWTTPTNFYASVPPIVTQTAGKPDAWLDFWVICDDTNCHLFFADDNGHYYRAQTTVANFPNGFGTPAVVLTDSQTPTDIFEAGTVFKLNDTGKYLAVIEAFDAGSMSRRYYRSWTADKLDGAWTPLAGTYAAPFASAANTTFTMPPAWTNDISSGEVIRSGYDQHAVVDPCHLQYIYQGDSPSSSGLPYNSIPWKVGLLTKTN